MVVTVKKNAPKTKNEYPQTAVEITPGIQALLANFTAEEIETGVVKTGRPATPGSHTTQDLKDALQVAQVEDTIGGMLRAARQQHDHSLQDAGDTLGITRSRVHQLEQPEANLRIDTLMRFASAYGYTVKVVLVPANKDKEPIVAHLASNA